MIENIEYKAIMIFFVENNRTAKANKIAINIPYIALSEKAFSDIIQVK